MKIVERYTAGMNAYRGAGAWRLLVPVRALLASVYGLFLFAGRWKDGRERRRAAGTAGGRVSGTGVPRIVSVGNIEIGELTAKVLNMNVSGAGNCKIHKGQVIDQSLRISGAGGYQASDLQSQNADIDISGLGGARVWVEESLRVEISGAGNVTYFGNPNISHDVSGVGQIESLGVKQ